MPDKPKPQPSTRQIVAAVDRVEAALKARQANAAYVKAISDVQTATRQLFELQVCAASLQGLRALKQRGLHLAAPLRLHTAA